MTPWWARNAKGPCYHQMFFSFSSFYSIQDPSPQEGAAYTQVGSLSLLILSAKALTGTQTPKAVLHSCLGYILF